MVPPEMDLPPHALSGAKFGTLVLGNEARLPGSKRDTSVASKGESVAATKREARRGAFSRRFALPNTTSRDGDAAR